MFRLRRVRQFPESVRHGKHCATKRMPSLQNSNLKIGVKVAVVSGDTVTRMAITARSEITRPDGVIDVVYSMVPLAGWAHSSLPEYPKGIAVRFLVNQNCPNV